ncbi:MAG: hypothetical protein AB1297_06605 [bacterium]
MIKEVVGIRFLKDPRINYCDCGEISIEMGKMYLVEMEGYCDIGLSVEGPKVLDDEKIKEHIPRVYFLLTVTVKLVTAVPDGSRWNVF